MKRRPVIDRKVRGILDRTIHDVTTRPTVEAYSDLEAAFDYFNETLFRKHYGVLLPHVVMTLPKNQGLHGYFMHGIWNGTDAQTHFVSEIGLNLRESRQPQDVFATLVHEMVHLAQAERPQVFGVASDRGYHNKAFADVMERIGLMASNTGKPGGSKTGRQMTHYVIGGGAFAAACQDYIEQGASVSWVHSLSRRLTKPDELLRLRKKRSKTKYSCPACHMNAWAKPNTHIICGACRRDLIDVSTNQ